jgi:hypothetical protein
MPPQCCAFATPIVHGFVFGYFHISSLVMPSAILLNKELMQQAANYFKAGSDFTSQFSRIGKWFFSLVIKVNHAPVSQIFLIS